MADKKSFVVRHENTEQFDMLDDKQLGQLFRAMYRFSVDGTEPEFDDPMLKMLFSVVRGQLERDAEKYAETCKKRAESGQKGGRPPKKAKKQKVFQFFQKMQRKQKKLILILSVIVYVYVIVNVSVILKLNLILSVCLCVILNLSPRRGGHNTRHTRTQQKFQFPVFWK